jgi:predicted ATP-grasp superfamily ATP-dependent carboligase
LAIILVAALLLNVVAKEILDDPHVVHDLAQSGPSAQQVWNAFSSENRRISSMHGRPRFPVPR